MGRCPMSYLRCPPFPESSVLVATAAGAVLAVAIAATAATTTSATVAASTSAAAAPTTAAPTTVATAAAATTAFASTTFGTRAGRAAVEGRDVLCLRSLLALSDVELDLLSFLQLSAPTALDRG